MVIEGYLCTDSFTESRREVLDKYWSQGYQYRCVPQVGGIKQVFREETTVNVKVTIYNQYPAYFKTLL